MHDALLMRRFDCFGDLFRDRERFFQRDRTLLNALSQRGPFHQLHHQVIPANVVELADVGMIQRGHGAHFARKAIGEALLGDFDGDVAAHARIVGAVDLSHAAGADRRKHLIRAEPRSNSQCHKLWGHYTLRKNEKPEAKKLGSQARQRSREAPDRDVSLLVPRCAARSPTSHLDTEMYHVMEQVAKVIYPGTAVLPSMSTGASDGAQLGTKGIQSYGIGPAAPEEDALNYPAHGDAEPLAESSLYPFVRYVWEVATEIACIRGRGLDSSLPSLRIRLSDSRLGAPTA
jgi:hypothetical protein